MAWLRNPGKEFAASLLASIDPATVDRLVARRANDPESADAVLFEACMLIGALIAKMPARQREVAIDGVEVLIRNSVTLSEKYLP